MKFYIQTSYNHLTSCLLGRSGVTRICLAVLRGVRVAEVSGNGWSFGTPGVNLRSR